MHNVRLKAQHMAVGYADHTMVAAAPREDTRVFSINVCRTPADIEPLLHDWRALEATAASQSVFTSSAWATKVLEQFSSDAAFQAVIMTARDNGRLVALWPLAIQSRNYVRVLASIGAPLDQYSEILIDRAATPGPIIGGILGKLRSADVADGLILRKLKVSGPLFKQLSTSGRTIDGGDEAPKVSIDPDAPFDDFMSTVKSKTRKNLRNYTNRLERLGNLEHKVVTGTAAADVIAQSFVQRRTWLADNGLSSEAFRDPRFKPFVHSLGATGNDLQIIAFAMLLDGEPIALQWGFIHQRQYFAFISSRNPEFEKYSVGRIHLQHIIEECHTRGLTTLDLMVPAVPYKLSWTKTTEHVVDVIWPWTLKGHVVLGVIEQHVRPHMKKLAHQLPDAIRKPLMRLANR
ncbi:MAG: GNAT family N-acetyltransferase [Pseudomonadota bacterium]